MNNTDLIQKLEQLKGISDEERMFLIDLINTRKKYGLVWEDKTENVEEELRDKIPVLKEVEEKAIINDTNSPNHTIIEGENLYALTSLISTHQNLIDVIYIDPPYNTGSKEFKYNDRSVDKDDSYRHSKWLSFMHKRLQIAKRLLSDKGVIFISIDDNERAQLRLLCDEIFGEENCYGEMAWLTRTGSMDNVTNFSKDHESILIYGKTLGRLNGIQRTFSRYKNPDNDPRGAWIADNLSASKPGGNTLYAVVDPGTGNEFWPPKGRYWPYNPETMMKKIDERRILFPKTAEGSPLIKRFKSEAKFQTLPISSWIISETTPESKRKNNTIYATYNTSGTKELQEILGDKVFEHPKPTALIMQLLEQSSDANSTILDFFAGSGTTLHATMKLNNKDGGNRKCILITNNENGICENVTYKRNKNVICGYTNNKGEFVNGLIANNLKYYKAILVHQECSR